jgi:hypothetical protein
MLNGDAHHSSVWEIEPRIWPLLNCQRRVILKRKGAIRKQKFSLSSKVARIQLVGPACVAGKLH